LRRVELEREDGGHIGVVRMQGYVPLAADGISLLTGRRDVGLSVGQNGPAQFGCNHKHRNEHCEDSQYKTGICFRFYWISSVSLRAFSRFASISQAVYDERARCLNEKCAEQPG